MTKGSPYHFTTAGPVQGREKGEWGFDCIIRVSHGPRARAQMEEIRRQLAAAKLEADRVAAAAAERERKIREVNFPLLIPWLSY